jgi:anti-repressor protein
MKQNKLQIFNNQEFGEIRTVVINNEILFFGVDVANALEYARPSKAVSDNCKGVLTEDSIQNSGGYPEKLIKEGDVYRLIIKASEQSNSHTIKEKAEKFESWVFDEVLPSIHKHGAYMTNDTIEKALTSPDFLIQLATKLKEEQERNKALEEDNKRMKPKEIFADAVSASDSSMLVRDVAKMIRQNGVPLGEKRFYKWLRENGYICKTDTTPTQKAMELGLFEVIVRTVERGNGLPIETKTTKVTGKGQQYFINKFLSKTAQESIL